MIKFIMWDLDEEDMDYELPCGYFLPNLKSND